MPTYAYRCADCGHAFDAVQAFTDDSLTVCPVCGGRLRKQFGTVGVTFNGSGFYRTDSRANVSAGSEGSSGGSADSAGASKDSSSGASSSPAPAAAKPASGSGTSGSGSPSTS